MSYDWPDASARVILGGRAARARLQSHAARPPNTGRSRTRTHVTDCVLYLLVSHPYQPLCVCIAEQSQNYYKIKQNTLDPLHISLCHYLEQKSS